jgi:tubulin-specific chaperone A
MPPKKEQSPAQKLKVQVGVCKRMQKEVTSYEKEVVTNEARIQKMKDDGRDEYDIRKQEEVLQESYMMVPDSKSRLEKALGELSELWDEFQEDESISAELREETAALLGMSASSSEAAAVTDL